MLDTGEAGKSLENHIFKKAQEVWETGVKKNMGEITLQIPRSVKK